MADGAVLRWITAYTCSVSGDSVYFVTLSWAASRSLGPAAAGIVLAVGAVPRALLMLGGGVVADRYGPRRVLIGSDLVRCVLVAGAALAVVGRVYVGVLAVLAVGFGIVDALFMPAVGALPPVLVAADQLARVQGMRVLAVRAANLAGPVLAGVMLGVGGASASFLMAAALFGASLLGLMTLRIPHVVAPAAAPQTETDTATDTDTRHRHRHRNRHRPKPSRAVQRRSEIRHHHTELRRLVIVIGLSELCFSGPIAVAVVMLVAERHWSSTTAGWILGAFSIGGAAVAGAMAALAERIGRPRLLLAGSLALTAALLLLWGAFGRPGAVAISAALGATTGVTTVVANARLANHSRPAVPRPRHLGDDPVHARSQPSAVPAGRRRGPRHGVSACSSPCAPRCARLPL